MLPVSVTLGVNIQHVDLLSRGDTFLSGNMSGLTPSRSPSSTIVRSIPEQHRGFPCLRRNKWTRKVDRD
eukprot:11052535-Heterocapsa_arctica.AAC.1